MSDEQAPEPKPKRGKKGKRPDTEGGTEIVLVDPTDITLPPAERHAMSLDVFRELEDELFQEAAQTIHGALDFSEIDQWVEICLDDDGTELPELECRKREKPPKVWSEKYGEKEAKKRLRLARAAWMPRHEAPIGLTIASAIYIGIARVRAGDKLVHQTLNIGHVDMVLPSMQFPEVEVEEKIK